MRCRKKGHHIVTKCGKVAKYNADQHLQELYRLEVFAKQHDLDQHQYDMKKDRGFSHLDAPHTGHGVRDGTDRRYAEVRFYGQGDSDCHDKKPDKIHRDSYF